MHPEAEPGRQAEQPLMKRYLERLAVAKKVYLEHIRETEERYRNVPRENYPYYNSPLDGDDPVSRKPSGYFNSNSPHSFYESDGFDAESFTEEIDAFRQKPENKDRPVMIFDAMGQGTPFVGIADEIISTTLLPNHRRIQDVTEFAGDALSGEVANRVFSHLARRIQSGAALRATFFRPLGGLEQVAHNLYVFHRLYENLLSVYELTDDGGLLFIRTAGSGFDVPFLREIFESFGLSTMLSASKFGNASVVIRKNAALAAKLPGLKEVAAKHPKMLERLLNIDSSEKDARDLVLRKKFIQDQRDKKER